MRPGDSSRRGQLPARSGMRWLLALCTAVLVSGCTAEQSSPADPSASGSTPDAAVSTSVSTAPPAKTENGVTAGERACEHGGADVRVGVFRETQREEVDAYQQWLGCRVDYVVDFSSRDTWWHISRPTYLLDEWEGVDRRLVLSVAMLPRDEPADFTRGAAGDYDRHYVELAQLLIERDREDTILRIGWEFNLTNSQWYTTDTEAFRTYYRRIVDAMRSVPGHNFEFTWNPGRSGVDAVPYYPGDEWVDHIGLDVYDAVGGVYPYPADCGEECRAVRQRTAWFDHSYGGDRGLGFWAEFARQHGKPFALPEWGVWERPDGTGGGENEFFIRRMVEFISDPANNVAYQAYFEHDGSDGSHRLMTTYADLGDVYRGLLAPL